MDGAEDERRHREMGESTWGDYECHSWTSGRRLVEKAKSTAKRWSSNGLADRLKDGVKSQKVEVATVGTHAKRSADVGNTCLQPSSPFNWNSNKERIGSFGPKLFGEVWVERDKAHSSVEDWHRAFNAMQEGRAHSPQKPRPLVEANLGWERGFKLKGPMTTLGQELGRNQPNFGKGSLRKEDTSTKGKGKSISEDSSSKMRGSTTKFGSKKLWTNLNPLTSSCRQEVRKRSEPLMQAIPSSDFVAPPKDIAFKVGTQMVRRYSLSPLIFSLPLGFRRSCSGEGASSTRGNADNQQRYSLKASIHSKGKAKLCKFSNVVDRVDFEGFGGSAHCGFSVLVFPSSPVTREKGLTSMGTCGLMVVENNEVSSSPLSQSSL